MGQFYYIKTLFLLSAILIFNACGKDDEPVKIDIDNTPFTEIEKNILGGWPELGDNGMTFMRNGIVVSDGEVGHWKYDETTGILTTDVINYRGQVMMWQISMLNEGSMVGTQLWNDKTFSAKMDVKQAIEDILSSRSWTRDKDSKLLVINFLIDNKNLRYSYESHYEDFWVSANDMTIDDSNLSGIIIYSEMYGKHVIHNPYNYEMVSFEFPRQGIYYPVTDLNQKRYDKDMSKEESRLVGRWICSEQFWQEGSDTETKVYLDGDYGIEFYEDFWTDLWAGSDELMEDGGSQFSWMLKNGSIYTDYEIYKINKITDKDLELEWRDDDYTIRCKFYKYNQEEGYLSDQIEYVDLGLSVKWATRNLGAEKDPKSIGGYYAWGETEAKQSYMLDNYKFWKQTQPGIGGLTKYCSNPANGYSSYVDNKTMLDSEDDAATVIRGKDWRMPTKDEIWELVDDCTWTWTDINGHDGYKVTGKNGYYIFLPLSGYRVGEWSYDHYDGFYLTKESNNDDPQTDIPLIPVFSFSQKESPKNKKGELFSLNIRYYGYCIRPVHE